jgi:curved DNA-binding protein CbpA
MKNYFKNCLNLDEAKKLYFDLAKKLHPDKGGNTADFQELANEFEKFTPTPENEKFKGEFNQWNAREYAHIIEELIKIPDIIIEICGSFIWIGGETKKYVDQIKAINTGDSYKRGWSNEKVKWKFFPSSYRKFNKMKFSMNQIRSRYGSEIVENEAYKRMVTA